MTVECHISILEMKRHLMHGDQMRRQLDERWDWFVVSVGGWAALFIRLLLLMKRL